MNNKNFIFILIVLIFCFSCNKTPNDSQEFQSQIKLKDDLSETEFKKAIVGKWESVFEAQGKKSIEYLELNQEGDAKIIIKIDGNKKEYDGNYSITYLRTPAEGMVTLAELTIKTDKESIILSRMNFGLHNAFPTNSGYFLRNDEEPFGVLKK